MSLWGITTFYNPYGYKTKKKNFDIFRSKSKAQGLNLITVELGFNGFELSKDDSDILVQIEGNKENLLWQKERLLNIALKYLPDDCDNVAWIDADILFQNDNWINEAEELLKSFPVIQLFSMAYRLPKDVINVSDVDIKKSEIGRCNGRKLPSFALCSTKKMMVSYGFAWASTRKFLDTCGFFDYAVVGGGDYFMANGFFSRQLDNYWESSSPIGLMIKWHEWAKKAYEFTQGKLSCLDGTITHLWHGDIDLRNYQTRNRILGFIGYLPERDLKLNKNDIWEWISPIGGLPEIEKYFNSRKEDTDDEDKFIVCKGSSGLGDRLHNFASGLLYGKIHNRKLIVDWRDRIYSDNKENSFFSFFECDDVINIDIPSKSCFPKIWQGKENVSIYDLAPKKKEIQGLVDRLKTTIRSQVKQALSMNISLSYGEKIVFLWTSVFNGESFKPKEFIEWGENNEQIFSYILKNKIKPVKDIQATIDYFKNTHSFNIGVHIRNTDRQCLNVDEYFNALDSLDKSTILLCTDSMEITKSFKKRYGDRIVSTDKHFPIEDNVTDFDRLEGREKPLHFYNMGKNNGIGAVMDMYLLASCDYIIYSSVSSFAKCAVALSDSKNLFDIKG